MYNYIIHQYKIEDCCIHYWWQPAGPRHRVLWTRLQCSDTSLRLDASFHRRTCVRPSESPSNCWAAQTTAPEERPQRRSLWTQTVELKIKSNLIKIYLNQFH